MLTILQRANLLHSLLNITTAVANITAITSKSKLCIRSRMHLPETMIYSVEDKFGHNKRRLGDRNPGGVPRTMQYMI